MISAFVGWWGRKGADDVIQAAALGPGALTASPTAALTLKGAAKSAAVGAIKDIKSDDTSTAAKPSREVETPK
jgi:hypothetical protein